MPGILVFGSAVPDVTDCSLRARTRLGTGIFKLMRCVIPEAAACLATACLRILPAISVSRWVVVNSVMALSEIRAHSANTIPRVAPRLPVVEIENNISSSPALRAGRQWRPEVFHDPSVRLGDAPARRELFFTLGLERLYPSTIAPESAFDLLGGCIIISHSLRDLHVCTRYPSWAHDISVR